MSRQPDDIAELHRAIGQSLASHREASPLSQGDLARETNYHRTSISHIEAGRQFPTERVFWEKVDGALAAGGALVSQYEQVIATHSASEASNRRPARYANLRKSSTSLNQLNPDYYPQIEFENDESAMWSGMDMSAMRAMSEAFQIADRKVGGGKLYGTVVRYLATEVAPQLLGTEGKASAADVFAAAASLTEIAGWMAHDGGSNGQARRHFDRAFRLSSAADNLALSANVCASMSHLATQLHSPRDAIRIADAGLATARKAEGASRLRARLFAMRVRGQALDGQTHECASSLRAAEHILDSSENEPPAEWIASFDHGSLASETALCFQSLGNLSGAERQASKAIELRDGDRVRSRAFAQLTLANVLVRRGRIAEAAIMGTHVCRLMRSLNSARVVTGLTDLACSLRPHSTVSEVRDLLEQWSSMTSASKRSAEADLWPV